MVDRLVRQVNPSPASGEGEKPFSAYSAQRNIVLLGDPGAGKTHLFREFADIANGEYLSTRAFLSRPVEMLRSRGVLFVDALDEKRAGRGDQNTIDAVVRRLWEVDPPGVRISCRVADWLGETDLSAFGDYFSQAGGCVVLALEPLSESERTALLETRGVRAAPFLAEARKRGLDELLGNPQNLIMLSDVVSAGEWPRGRAELFERSTSLLLSEHNEGRVRTGSTESLDALAAAAGAVCALRLIGDVEGISLLNETRDQAFPSWRDIAIEAPSTTGVALQRRLFVRSNIPETVDYAHRTVAEYLAARWLAHRIRAGLPVGRVRALIGVDGRPASELRGLHAWLPVFLPSFAGLLIDGDPLGVLTYGDASSLSTQDRKHLVRALAKLAETDPWFRDGHWSASAVASLSGSDLIDDFRSVLQSSSNFSLRSIILDSLVAGPAHAEMLPDLVAILSNSAGSYSERHASIEALVNIGEAGEKALIVAYSKLGSSSDDLRLRATILESIAPRVGGATEIAVLLSEGLKAQGELRGGSFLPLLRAVRDEEIETVLKAIKVDEGATQATRQRHNAFEILHIFDRLLMRLLLSSTKVSGERLFDYLRVRKGISHDRGTSTSDELRDALSATPAYLVAVVDHALRSLGSMEERIAFTYDIRELTLGAVTDEIIIDGIAAVLDDLAPSERKVLYASALTLTFGVSAAHQERFTRLFEYAEGQQDLEQVRSQVCVATPPEWRVHDRERRALEAATRDDRRRETQEVFAKEGDSIKTGYNLNGLEWAAQVYLDLFNDLEAAEEPRERLIAELAPELAQVALEGLVAFIERGAHPDLAEVIALARESKYFPWWYAVVAGLDEYMVTGHLFANISDDCLRAALAINCLHPTSTRRGRTIEEREHEWKTLAFQKRPELVAEVYSSIVHVFLEKGAAHIRGLYELMESPELAAPRGDLAVALLSAFPAMSADHLRYVLSAALRESPLDNVRTLAERAVVNASEPRSKTLWLAAGLLTGSIQLTENIAALTDLELQKEVIWSIRDLGGFGRRKSRPTSLSLQQLASTIRVAGAIFGKTSHPSGAWSGDRNAWDATDFIIDMIGRIASDPSREASEHLEELAADTALASYRDDLRHAAAQQRVRRVDAEFQQPDWKESLQALSNRAPANVADLHALTTAHLKDLATYVASSNTDAFKRFWNEDQYGRTTTPKNEESARDVLLDLLRTRFEPQGVIAEPEGHMVADKRADIVTMLRNMKVVIELKRDYHTELWSALESQLDRFYTRDPGSKGFGIYGVFWYGAKRPKNVPQPPAPLSAPASRSELYDALVESLAPTKQRRLEIVVFDVSGEV